MGCKRVGLVADEKVMSECLSMFDYILRSMFCRLNSVFCVPYAGFCVLRSDFYTLGSEVCMLRCVL